MDTQAVPIDGPVEDVRQFEGLSVTVLKFHPDLVSVGKPSTVAVRKEIPEHPPFLTRDQSWQRRQRDASRFSIPLPCERRFGFDADIEGGSGSEIPHDQILELGIDRSKRLHEHSHVGLGLLTTNGQGLTLLLQPEVLRLPELPKGNERGSQRNQGSCDRRRRGPLFRRPRPKQIPKRKADEYERDDESDHEPSQCGSPETRVQQPSSRALANRTTGSRGIRDIYRF